MDDMLIKIRLVLKAEIILLRLQLRRTVQQAAFYIAAALLAVLAVGMLNIALYQCLAPRLGNASAALMVAIVDIMLAATSVVAAGRLHLGPEVDAARALREGAMANLAEEAEHVKTQIAEIQDDVKRIRTAVTGLMSFGSFNLASFSHWVPVLLRFLLRRKDS